MLNRTWRLKEGRKKKVWEGKEKWSESCENRVVGDKETPKIEPDTENLTMSLLLFYSELLSFTNMDFKLTQIIKVSCTFCNYFFLLSLLCLRCISGALLHSPPPHWHPLVLPGAGGRPKDQTWQHRCLELRLPTAGRHRGFQSDGECRHDLVNRTLVHHTGGFTKRHDYIGFTGCH